MRSATRSFQHGLTLAEIGMALFAIGVGALSIATVYLQREHTVSITAQQATAQDLAADMTSRIDTRRSNAADVLFENAIGVRCAQSLANPTPQAKTTNEVACWQERVAAQLPNGSGSIALDASTVPATYVVTVSWSLPRGGLASYSVRVAANATTTAQSLK
jgi:Tfp pilus assembly protein PilV